MDGIVGMAGTERHAYLEGLRGLACVQVLLLHGLGAFLPGSLDLPAPLRLVFEGDTAVFLFFVLSGHVLTAPFLRGIAHPGRLVAGRVVRFLLPATLACALGWMLAGPAGEAGRLLDSPWLHQNVPSDMSGSALLRDAGLNVLLLGYAGMSVFDGVLTLWPNGAGFNPPLWTLSVELQGSLLVLALCRLRGLADWVWPAGLLFAVLVLGRTPMLAFLAGHVLALHRADLRLLGVTLAGAAVTVAAGLDLLPALMPEMEARCLGAIAIFVLVRETPALRRALSGPRLSRLGALSFPLYLLHWPLLFGPGAAVAIALAPLGPIMAGAGGMIAGLALCGLMAVPFRRIDLLALAWSRRVRQWRLVTEARTLPA